MSDLQLAHAESAALAERDAAIRFGFIPAVACARCTPVPGTPGPVPGSPGLELVVGMAMIEPCSLGCHLIYHVGFGKLKLVVGMAMY